MINLIKSLRSILPSSDFNTLLTMPLVLTMVALIEVGGLAAIAFLILNLEDLDAALLELKYTDHLLAMLGFSNEQAIFLFTGIIFLYSFFTIIVSSISVRRISIFSELMGAKIKTLLLQHFLNLDWLDFSKTQSSKNMSRIAYDGDIVADMINHLMNLVNKMILALIITIALFIFNAALTLILALVLSVTYFFIFHVFKSKSKKNSLEITKLMDTTLNIITNVFGSFKEILFYNNQRKVVSNFERVNSNQAIFKGMNMSLSYMPRFYIDSALLMILITASIFVSHNEISTPSFFAILSVYGIAALKLLPAFQNIFYFAYEIHTRMPHLNNVNDLLKKTAKNNFLNSNNNLLTFQHEIAFKNISFAYTNDRAQSLISDINLKILRNQKIAIIGPTGSGKSTFLDLLLGFIEPNSGQITMDGEPVGRDNFQGYRTNFSYVPQKIFFLEDTIKQNIVFGSRGEFDRKKLDQVIFSSSLKDLIDDLPDGIETKISDSSQMVSGGQKQCIGIARALYRGGDILILDEATSGMDQSLEQKIYEAVFKSNFQSFICVTHRISVLDKFDQIFVFNKGRIESMGSYEELKKSSSFLNNMTKKSI